MKVLISFVFAILMIDSGLLAQDFLASKRLIQALKEEVYGEFAFQFTVWISHFDRIQASDARNMALLIFKNGLSRFSEDYYNALIKMVQADKKNLYYDIAQAVSAEYGPVDVRDVDYFFKTLEKAELVHLKKIEKRGKCHRN